MTFLSTLWGLKEDTASSRHGFSCQFNDETYLVVLQLILPKSESN